MRKNFFLTDQQRFFICNLHAQYKKPGEIQKMLLEQFGRKVCLDTIVDYRKTQTELINNLREKWLNSAMDIPIAYKRIRLERAEELYNLSQDLKGKERILSGLECLKTACNETEGKFAGGISFTQVNQYNNYTDEELLVKKRELEAKIINLEAEVKNDS
jgi:hypothetical protein